MDTKEKTGQNLVEGQSAIDESRLPKKIYSKPVLKRHNEIVEAANSFNFQGTTPGAPAGAQTSPTVPGAVVF